MRKKQNNFENHLNLYILVSLPLFSQPNQVKAKEDIVNHQRFSSKSQFQAMKVMLKTTVYTKEVLRLIPQYHSKPQPRVVNCNKPTWRIMGSEAGKRFRTGE